MILICISLGRMLSTRLHRLARCAMNPTRYPAWRAALLSAAMLPWLVTASQAAEGIGMELNKLEQAQNACRLYLVFDNKAADAFDEFKLDLVLFGRDGVIQRRFALDAGPLRPTKMSVKLFDVPGLACAELGQVLVNDITLCRTAQGERNDCVQR